MGEDYKGLVLSRSVEGRFHFERNEAIYATYKETRGEGIKTKAKKIKFIKMLILEAPEGGWKSKKNAAEVLAIKMAEQNESLVKVKNRLVFWLSRDSTVSDAFYASKTFEQLRG
ncbi:hypothetical protein [Laribacter hongkongensis]|uniref:hypothetical protein n=1 Tax=Laribacter hongkongensis TaxID=168471 RepID=UPI00167F9274|nr:hypothetical protein [Laribacter hongkongensis]